ncbi:PAS domain S-box protein [Thioalkalivibrio sp. ALJT]|uniref:PAS domain S-box protein n=1 Tax=Thioalkalivibrio sp. ALJT TaxID=1158146 RepID=UPI0003767CCE|nr:PAS domain S-box protein [Thioalkalivibrio sp. ALJT]
MSLFDRIPVGLALLDPHDARIVRGNPRLAAWLGCAPEALTGLAPEQWLAGDVEPLQAALVQVQPRTVFGLRLLPQDAQGEPRAVQLEVAPGTGQEEAAVVTVQPLPDTAAAADAVYAQTFTRNTAPKLLVDPDDGAIVDANPAAADLYGYSTAALRRMSIQEINTLTPEEVKAEMALAASENRRFFRFRHRIRNGEILEVEVYSGPVELGGRTYLYSIIHDVSAARRYEHELEYYSELVRNLPVGVYRSGAGPDGHLRRLNPAMLTLFEADAEERLRALPVRQLYVDPAAYEDLSRELDQRGRVAGREVTLRSLRGRVFRARVSAHRMQDAEGRMVHDGMIEDITEAHAGELLRSRMLGALAEGVFGIDREGRYTFMNPAACRLLGFSSEAEALGLNSHTASHHTRVDGTPYPAEDCPIHRVLATGESLRAWNDHFWRADGAPVPVRVYAAPVEDLEGNVDGAVVSFQDLGLHAERERRLTRAAGQLPGAIYEFRRYPDGRMVFPLVTAGIQRVFGMTPDEAREHPEQVLERVHPDDRARLDASNEHSSRTLAPWQLRLRVCHPTRGTLWIEGRATPERRGDGSVVWYGVIVDITDQVQMEASLRESETRFRQLAGSVNEVFWLRDECAILYVNPAYEAVWGRSREALYADPGAMLEAVDPEDRQQVEAIFMGSALKRGSTDVTFRIHRPDGELRWIQAHCYPVEDAEGETTRVAGTAVDVTELKQTQLELEQSNAALASAALYDRLTGIANRRYFEELLEREMRRVDRSGGSFALVMFDLDHFKRVNDSFGHDVGDEVLKDVTDRVASRLRDSDVLGRWGGEEFMVLLPAADLDSGATVAETLRERVAGTPCAAVGTVTISLGVAEYLPGEPRKQLLRRVDQALYRAKNAGRNRVEVDRVEVDRVEVDQASGG